MNQKTSTKLTWPFMVEVEWKDCCYSDGFNDSPGLATVFTVGYVVDDTEEYLAVVKEQYDQTYRRITSIPKSCIVRVRQLRYK